MMMPLLKIKQEKRKKLRNLKKRRRRRSLWMTMND
jgi:hypothetical protein